MKDVTGIFAATICHRIAASSEEVDEGQLELDSHADSPVLGKGAIIVRKTDRTVSVKGFADEIGNPISVPVVDGLVAYDCEYSGETRLLIIRNALHLPSMNNHLIPPFMMRLAGVKVNECAKFLATSPNINHHSIYFPEEMLRIPLQLAGITSYIPTRVPREDEINDLQELELTPQMNVWNPHSSLYREQEDSMLDYKVCLREKNLKTKNRHLISSATTYEPKHAVSCVIDRSTDTVLLADDLIARRHCSNTTPLLLEDKINRISSIRTSRDHMINVVKNNGTKTDLTSERLAEVFDIYWLSKKQAGVESSTFGSEFLAMKHCCEYLRGLRYKIRMMGIPMEHCCFVYGDNKSVLYNTTLPDSTLKKKHHSIAYHYVREGCANDEWRTAYIKTDDNCSDITTKSLPNGINRKRKVRSVMYDIYPEENDRKI